MNKIKELQAKYTKGELTKAQYLAELAKLVTSEDITQDEMDEATDFNPEADKPIYTQADVDGMIARKSAQALRKILKDAGVEVDASNKDLSGKLVEMVKVATGKMEAPKGAEVETLRAKAAKADALVVELKNTRLENALLKTVGKYKPVSQAAVIALLKSDYQHAIEYLDEETGEIDAKSLDRAVKRMQIDHQALFTADDGGKTKEDGDFRGKGPGGAGGAGTDKTKEAALARGREILGTGKNENAK